MSGTSKPQSATPAADKSPIGTQTSWPILIAAMVLLILPIVTLSQLAAHNRVDVVDDQMFGYFGWRIAHGAVVYEDVWDNKPPGIYWINALGFLIGGDSYGGVIFLCVLAVAGTLVCFFIISASVYFRGAAAAATVLASFYLTHGFFQGGTNRTETFLMLFELAAVALYFRGCARDHWWKWLLAGVCGGCAFLLKQVGLAAWGTLGLHTIILVIMGDLPWRRGLKRCLLLLGGMVAVVGAATVVIVAQGAAEHAYFAVFGFNRAYFSAGKSSLTDFELNRYMLRQHVSIALLLPMLMTITALIHAFLWWVRPHFRPADIESQIRTLKPVCPRYMLLFLIWFVVAYYGAAISPHHYRHYLLPTLPPLLLMAGYLINFLRGEISLTKRFQQRIWVTAAFVAMGYFASGSIRWHLEELSKVWLFRFEEGRQAEWEVIGDAAARLTRPDDRIQCLGYTPGVYLRARRLNASRYTTTEKIGQVSGSHEADIIRRELIEEVKARRPALIIMSANDYDMIQSAAPKDPDGDSWDAWWQRTLRDDYERALEIEELNVLIFQRKGLAAERTLATGP